MIVVGCRGLGAIGRRLLGSVSSGLVHHAHCPVAVIHDEDPMMPHPSEAPVVVGIDGSPASEQATAIAFEEASRRGVDLVAVHAWSDFSAFDLPADGLRRAREGSRGDAGGAARRVARALSRRQRATCRFTRQARTSASRAVGVCAIDGSRQPRPRWIRRDAAGLGQFGRSTIGPHAGDRRSTVLRRWADGRQSSERRWDWSSFDTNTAAWVRRSMPSFANRRET